MAERVYQRSCTLVAPQPVTVEGDIVLPAGRYSGTVKQTGIMMMKGETRTSPQYRIELSAEQLRSFGAQVSERLISMEVDVTRQVESGDLRVS